MRFIATADWQLGMTARYLDNEARPRYQQARLDAVRAIGELARERDAEFVMVAGDVFETNQLDDGVVGRALEALREVPVPVYLLPGNHDPLDATSIYDSKYFLKNCPANVVVLRSSEPLEPRPGVQIVGVPWRTKIPAEDTLASLLLELTPAPPGMSRVLVAHGGLAEIAGGATSPGLIDKAKLEAALDAGKADFAVLGDRHSTMQVGAQIWYPGSPEPTDRTETDPGNVLLVEGTGPGEPWDVEVVPLGKWKYRVEEAVLTGTASVQNLIARLAEVPGKERTLLWLTLQGSLSVADKALLDAGLADLAGLYAKLDVWGRYTDLVVLPQEGDFTDLHLSGFAAAALAELAEQAASSGPESKSAADALGLLYRLVRR